MIKPALSAILFSILLLIAGPPIAGAQTEDSTHIDNKRLITVAGAHAITIGGTLVALNQVWYKQYAKSSFHVKNDLGEWLQVDKFGHAYSAYSMAGPMAATYQWSGLSRRTSVMLGSLESFAVLSTIEMMDAYSAEWGFSDWDMAANVFGTLLFAGQELLWEEQRIQYKFSSRIRKYTPALLEDRSKQVYGENIAERMLKDYNAQSYWLSVGIHSFYKPWPKWLNVAVGYGADDMYGAYFNTWKDANGKYYDKSDIHRYRQYFLSLDVNLANINTRYAFLNTVLDCLTIKVPAPTLEYTSQGKFIFHPLYY
ncbi:MAG: DUF2279 domain-containing protein [Chitinophagaceae bacterium]|nr:DUF2279 domain-containing protein [Chitinophagaceae bacterium]MCB9046377.1 DUF2279 domain-containing protein [Chitinophagales bacterium]